MRSAAFANVDGGGASVVMRRADPRRVEHLLHALLVAKGDGLLDGHPWDAERFTNTGGEHHGGLPERRDMVDVDAGGALHHLMDDGVLVGERRDLPVRGKVVAGQIRKARNMLVARADDRAPRRAQGPRVKNGISAG